MQMNLTKDSDDPVECFKQIKMLSGTFNEKWRVLLFCIGHGLGHMKLSSALEWFYL